MVAHQDTAPTAPVSPRHASPSIAQKANTSVQHIGSAAALHMQAARLPGQRPTTLLALQRAVGNQQVQRQLQAHVQPPLNGPIAELQQADGDDSVTSALGRERVNGGSTSDIRDRSPSRTGGAAVQRRPIQVPALGPVPAPGAAPPLVLVDTGTLTLDQMRAYFDNPHTPPASKAVLEKKLYKSDQRLSVGSVIQKFRTHYDQFMNTYQNVQILQVNVDARLQNLINNYDMAFGPQSYRLEDYFDDIRSQPTFANLFQALNQHLDPAAAALVPGLDAINAKERIADILIFSSLVPSTGGKRRMFDSFSRRSYYAIEILPPAMVVDVITVIRDRLVHPLHKNILTDPRFVSVGLVGGESDPQKMLKLALLNATAQARLDVRDNPAYQAILATPNGADILKFMFTSTGADEQFFMSTCPLSARNSRIATNSMTVAALITIGRRLAQHLHQMVTAHPVDAAQPVGSNLYSRAFGREAGELVESRIADATAIFNMIEQELTAMAGAPATMNVARLKELRQLWSYQMQKLGAVVNWQDPENLPQLAKKVIPDNWFLSAIPALGTAIGKLIYPNATTGYFNPPDEAEYRTRTADSMLRQAPPQYNNQRLGTGVHNAANRIAALQFLDHVWDDLLRVGGATVTQAHFPAGSHALFLKAIRYNGVKVFALNDPHYRAFKYFSLSEMYEYLTGGGIPLISGIILKDLRISDA